MIKDKRCNHSYQAGNENPKSRIGNAYTLFLGKIAEDIFMQLVDDRRIFYRKIHQAVKRAQEHNAKKFCRNIGKSQKLKKVKSVSSFPVVVTFSGSLVFSFLSVFIDVPFIEVLLSVDIQ